MPTWFGRSVPPQLIDHARRRLDQACPPRRGWVPGADGAGSLAPAEEADRTPDMGLGDRLFGADWARPAAGEDGERGDAGPTEVGSWDGAVGARAGDGAVGAGDGAVGAGAGDGAVGAGGASAEVGRHRSAGGTPGSDPGSRRLTSRGQHRVLDAVQSGWWGMAPRAAFGLALVGLLAAGFAAAILLRARPEAVPLERPVLAGPSVPASKLPAPTAAPAAPIVVHVAGLVHRPGVHTLRPGARVADAVQAAGGLDRKADLTALNLARPLADGEQVLVPARGAARGRSPVGPSGAGAGVAAGPGTAAAGGPGAAAGPGAAGMTPLDLNAATVEQLEELPGVGPVLAQRIAAWRSEHGRFSSVEELREVSGIGERKYADLAPRVRV